MRYQMFIPALTLILGGAAATAWAQPATPAAAPAGASAVLALLETTDLHANAVGYDYYKLAPDPSNGMDRLSTLITQARREFPNNLLLDSGDTIQGTALSDYQALVAPLPCDQILAIYKIMNHLGYDAGAIGNHEFNYGLAYLNQVTGSRLDVAGVPAGQGACKGPSFPLLLANVYSLKTRKPLFAPYRIIDKQVSALDADGKQVTATVKVGVIGFAPPAILSWDKRWLEGKVYADGIRETALRYIPEMRAQGADVVVALSHGGIDGAPYTPQMENANYHLAAVPGVDAILMGHQHHAFPNPRSMVPEFDLPGVDKVKGTIHGVPAVMSHLWGKRLGVIALTLRHDGARWTIDKARTRVETRSTQLQDRSFVPVDPAIAALVEKEHAATIGYIKTPIGAADFRMSTYFADVGDVSALAVINHAQAAYLKRYVQTNAPELARLPVLSVTAPFKAGMAGARDYTDVAAGPLALNHAGDLYVYPNVFAAVRADGALLKRWLERSAERFNTIDPASKDPQELVNMSFPAYNFDGFTSNEVSYEIDVSQPAGRRIRHLHFRGKAVQDADEFLIATNSYRAGGGGTFAGLDGSRTVVATGEANRDVLAWYIKDVRKLTRAVHGQGRSWRFTKLKTAGPVLVHAPPGMVELARQAGLRNVSQVNGDDGRGKGTASYAVDLSH